MFGEAKVEPGGNLMKKLALVLACLGCVFAAGSGHAMDLKQAKFTQVVNDVQIITANQQTQAAAVNDIFSIPDILQTGPDSRAELTAKDDTITRVGANTIFSFDPANRTIDLKQGSLLFNSPHGNGGGTIHTGSATASVLGTTLIVTTTPNGGMKVLDLEGTVDVNFANHLRQKLKAGQMTFILPGGTNVAPIINFELDTLDRNSLLVRGFTQSLPAMPLINAAVITQDKLIKSGHFTETGLLVGDTANPNQVEVVDDNTVGSRVAPGSLGDALESDATINQPSLTDASIPTPPQRVYPNQSFALPNNQFFGSQQFTGFFARNIFINTIAADPLTVDLSPYADLQEFDMVAFEDVDVEGSVTFAGFSPETSRIFSLIAGNKISIAQGATLEADTLDFLLSAPGALNLNGVTLLNGNGDITLNFGSDISLDNATINPLGTAFLTAAGDLNISSSTINADTAFLSAQNGALTLDSSLVGVNNFAFLTATGGINVNGSTVNAGSILLNGGVLANGLPSASLSVNNSTLTSASSVSMMSEQDITVGDSTINADPVGGTVSMTANTGSTSITGTSITAHYLTLNSGDGILLDASGHTLTASGSGATASFTAGSAPGNTITVNSADFSSFAELNMAANTIMLNGDTLAPISNFGTQTGQVNVNGTEIFGGLNLINCAWQNTPVASAGQVTLSSGPGNSPGIYSYAR